MATTIGELAEKIKEVAPNLAALLLKENDAALQAAWLAALGKALGVGDPTPENLLGPVSDPGNKDKVLQAEAEAKKMIDAAKSGESESKKQQDAGETVTSQTGGDSQGKAPVISKADDGEEGNEGGQKDSSTNEKETKKDTVCQPPRVDTEMFGLQDLSDFRKKAYTLKCGIAIVIILGFFVVTGLFFAGKGIDGARDQLGLLVGALIAAFTSVVQYYFGSSSGSAEKTIMMENKEQKQPKPPGS